MSFKVDRFAKVTISLGGKCPLRCRHCYTTSTQFRHEPKRSVNQVISELNSLDKSFSTICISGDTEPFLEPDVGLELIHEVAQSFSWTDIMFTTRLVLQDLIIDELIRIGSSMATQRRLLVPCISVITHSFPNGIEVSPLILATKHRLRMLRQFSRGNLPCFLTVRPTFPFEIVPKTESAKLLDNAAPHATVVLGEAFIVDRSNEIANEIGLSSLNKGVLKETSPMTFLDQPALWEKKIYQEEVSCMKSLCENHNVPFFLRSISGMKFLRTYWDFSKGKSIFTKNHPVDQSSENYLP